MNRVSIRQINAALIGGVILLSVLPISNVEQNRQYLGTLIAAWAVLHTCKLRGIQGWEFSLVPLSPRIFMLLQYLATAFLIMAAMYFWLVPIQEFRTATASMMLICLIIMFVKLVFTPV